MKVNQCRLFGMTNHNPSLLMIRHNSKRLRPRRLDNRRLVIDISVSIERGKTIWWTSAYHRCKILEEEFESCLSEVVRRRLNPSRWTNCRCLRDFQRFRPMPELWPLAVESKMILRRFRPNCWDCSMRERWPWPAIWAYWVAWSGAFWMRRRRRLQLLRRLVDLRHCCCRRCFHCCCWSSSVRGE